MRYVVAAVTSLALASCTVGPDYTPPAMTLEASYAFAPTGDLVAASTEAWWSAYRDSALNSLVAQGFAQNLDIKTARERIRQAEALYAGSMRGTTAIAGGFTGQALRTDSGGATVHQNSATLDANFAFDLFGGQTRRAQEARADLEATTYDLGTTRLAFMSSLVGAYLDARYYQTAMRLTQATIANRRHNLALVQELLDQGSASEVDRTRAEARLQIAIAEMPQFRNGFEMSAFRIATLLAAPGKTVLADLSKGGGQPGAAAPRAGVPANLLRNRPDILAAERRLAARTAAIGVAEAQLYPSLTLGGSISVTSGVNASTFGPRLTLPIFNRGVLAAGRKAAVSQAEQAELAWRQSVLKAVEDVQGGLAQMKNWRDQIGALQRAVNTYSRVGELTNESYRLGASTLIDLLDAEQEKSQAAISLAQARRAYAIAFAQLSVALGKGWRTEGEEFKLASK